MSTPRSSDAHAVLVLALGLLCTLHQASADCKNWDWTSANSFETGQPGKTALGNCAIQAASTKVQGDGFAIADYSAEGAPGHSGPAPGDDDNKQGAALRLSKAGKAVMAYTLFVDPAWDCFYTNLNFGWFACGDESKFNASNRWPAAHGQAARIDLFDMNKVMGLPNGEDATTAGHDYSNFLQKMLSSTGACDSSKGCLAPLVDATTIYKAVSDPSGCGWQYSPMLDLLPYMGKTVAVVVRAADDFVSSTRLQMVVDNFQADCLMTEQYVPPPPPPRPPRSTAPEPPLPPVIIQDGPKFPCCSCETKNENTPFKLQARPAAVLDTKFTETCFDIVKSTPKKASRCSNMGIKKIEINIDANCKYAVKGAYWKHGGKVERVTTSFDTCGSTLVWKANNMSIASASKYVSKSSKLCLKVQTGKCSSLASLCADGASTGKCRVSIFSNWTKGAPRCCPVTEMTIPKPKLLR